MHRPRSDAAVGGVWPVEHYRVSGLSGLSGLSGNCRGVLDSARTWCLSRNILFAVGLLSGLSGVGAVGTVERLSGSCRVWVSECRARAQLATAPKALATAPKALAPRICLEGACQRPKFSKGRLRRAFGQWGPSARLAISCATLAARPRTHRRRRG